MGAVGPSGSKTRGRDQRVKRVHIAAGRRTLCNKPQTQGDYDITCTGMLGKTASNLCKICQRVYFR